jgi:hypothetical protein
MSFRTLTRFSTGRRTLTTVSTQTRSGPHLLGRIGTPFVVAALLITACSSEEESVSVSATVETTTVETMTVETTTVGTTTAQTIPTQTTSAPAAIADTTTSPAVPINIGSGVITSIEVESTSEQYFVLYVKPDLTTTTEIPVAITRGVAGKTTLTDGRAQLPADHYRVATFSVSSPGDVDGDGVDDLTELDSPTTANPLNPAPTMEPEIGAVIIPDKATFEALSYQGDEVARDAYLAGLEFVKFWLVDTDTSRPSVYFMNTESFRAHPMFAQQVGIQGGRGPVPGKMRGDIVYDAEAIGPDGTPGRYRFAFQPNDSYSFTDIALAYELLATSMPTLAYKLTYYPFPQSALPVYEAEKARYDEYRVPVLIEE